MVNHINAEPGNPSNESHSTRFGFIDDAEEDVGPGDGGMVALEDQGLVENRIEGLGAGPRIERAHVLGRPAVLNDQRGVPGFPWIIGVLRSPFLPKKCRAAS